MAKQKRSSKFYFKREKEIIMKLGLIPTKASGSGWIEKEDGYNDHIIAQHKSTEANSYRIQMDDLRKLEYHSMVDNKTPLMIIDFIEHDKQYLLLRVDDLKYIYTHLNHEDLTVVKPELPDINIEPLENVNRPKIGSGNKEKYWDERNKEIQNRKGVKK